MLPSGSSPLECYDEEPVGQRCMHVAVTCVPSLLTKLSDESSKTSTRSTESHPCARAGLSNLSILVASSRRESWPVMQTPSLFPFGAMATGTLLFVFG